MLSAMPPPLPPDLMLQPLGDDPTVAELVARAFAENPAAGGPDRLATRLRAGATAIDRLSFAVRHEGALRASLQSWPVTLDTGGDRVAMVLIGPVAVEPAWHGLGLGRALVGAVVERLDRPAVLVGDEAYYARWAFTAAPTRGWRVDGEVERDRLLARGCGERLPVEGWLWGAGEG